MQLTHTLSILALSIFLTSCNSSSDTKSTPTTKAFSMPSQLTFNIPPKIGTEKETIDELTAIFNSFDMSKANYSFPRDYLFKNKYARGIKTPEYYKAIGNTVVPYWYDVITQDCNINTPGSIDTPIPFKLVRNDYGAYYLYVPFVVQAIPLRDLNSADYVNANYSEVAGFNPGCPISFEDKRNIFGKMDSISTAYEQHQASFRGTQTVNLNIHDSRMQNDFKVKGLKVTSFADGVHIKQNSESLNINLNSSISFSTLDTTYNLDSKIQFLKKLNQFSGSDENGEAEMIINGVFNLTGSKSYNIDMHIPFPIYEGYGGAQNLFNHTGGVDQVARYSRIYINGHPVTALDKKRSIVSSILEPIIRINVFSLINL